MTTASGPGSVQVAPRRAAWAGSACHWPLFTASNGEVMNEIT